MADTKPLKDKVILITGAGQGIGESTARYLAARGAILSLSDISKTTVDAVAQSIRDEFPDSLAFSQVVDVRVPAAVKGWVDMTKERFGRINGCVNNAGVLQNKLEPITELGLDDWQRVLDINLTGVFVCLQHELRAVADGGSIVNVGSVASWSGPGYFAAYVASKHGLVGLTKVAADEAGARGVRVNVVCPHLVETPLGLSVPQKSAGKVGNVHPKVISGMVQPIDVASMISYLLCDESRFVTKAVHKLDGGCMG